MNNQQITHIALEVGQMAGLLMTVLTAIPASSAPTWVPIVVGVLTAVMSWIKQEYGNTPQNVPGSTAQDIKLGIMAPALAPPTPSPVTTQTIKPVPPTL